MAPRLIDELRPLRLSGLAVAGSPLETAVPATGAPTVTTKAAVRIQTR